MTALSTYIAATQRLLQNPSAPSSLYAVADITSWINVARGQLAGEAECIRRIGTVTTVADAAGYGFTNIDIGNSEDTGIDSVIHVRSIRYGVGSAGSRWISPRSWEWFELYELNNPVPVSSFPKTWAQYEQGAAPGQSGSAQGGTFYISPPPNIAYTLYCDCVCYPLALGDGEEDNELEAIPYLWTDAVPFFAAYYALLSSQTQARMADAERYYQYYTTFVERARKASNPSVGRWQYQQSADPAQAAKMAIKQPGAA